MGLFERRELQTLELPPSLTPKCGSCGIYKMGCKSPKMPYSGEGRRKILILAEAPGEEEDRQGKQLVGNSGQELARILRRVGIDMRRDCWLENSLMCRPPKNVIPHEHAVADCRPHVIKTITELKPEVIIPLGGVACGSLLGWLWKDKVGGIYRWAGYRIPHRGLNAWICPTFHPSYLLHSKDVVLDRYFANHLEAASKLKGRPYKSNIQSDEDFCDLFLDTTEAAEVIRHVTADAAKHKQLVAFDYETTTLKPQGPYAELYTASIAVTEYGTGTDFAFAFPWQGKVVPAMRELLSDCKVAKVAHNKKIEAAWTLHFLKVRIAGRFKDTCTTAHALENGGKGRPVTGLKFQAFVKFGIDSYNDDMEQYLKSEGGNTPNRIKQAKLKDVLLYNALDSLYTLKLARVQDQILGDRK